MTVVPETVQVSGEQLVHLLAMLEDFDHRMCETHHPGVGPYQPFALVHAVAWNVAYEAFGIGYDDEAQEERSDGSRNHENHPIVAEIEARANLYGLLRIEDEAEKAVESLRDYGKRLSAAGSLAEAEKLREEAAIA
jgi:hypothetical protein